MNLLMFAAALTASFIFIFSLNAACEPLKAQEVEISSIAIPEEVKVVGEYYFDKCEPDQQKDCSNEESSCQEGIAISYVLRIDSALVEGSAVNPAYDVRIVDKMPYEAHLLSIQYTEKSEKGAETHLMPSYSEGIKPPYYINYGNLVEITLNSIMATDFPKEIKINTAILCNTGPATLYNSAMLSSLNDIDWTNNYATSKSYIGIAYDRRYGLDGYLKLIQKDSFFS